MIDKRLVEKEDFVSDLRDLLADGNPTVVANAVAALIEISERSDSVQLRLNASIASKLVSAMGECSEWVVHELNGAAAKVTAPDGVKRTSSKR